MKSKFYVGPYVVISHRKREKKKLVMLSPSTNRQYGLNLTVCPKTGVDLIKTEIVEHEFESFSDIFFNSDLGDDLWCPPYSNFDNADLFIYQGADSNIFNIIFDSDQIEVSLAVNFEEEINKLYVICREYFNKLVEEQLDFVVKFGIVTYHV